MPVPVIPPTGSGSTDLTYAIDDANLAVLSNASKSSLLSISNLGSAITSRINSTLELIQAFDEFTDYLLDETALDNLIDGGTSTTLQVSNTGSSNYVKVIIILNEITPFGLAPSITIDDGVNSYTVDVDTTTAKKRIEFNNIPAAFVSNFTVTNNLGVTLASYGNSVLVVGL